MKSIILAAITFFSVVLDSYAFIVQNTKIGHRVLVFHANEENVDALEEKKDEVEWGVSYIGGDPCGSKYNNDPFDTKPSKPGFPDDMKARIEAMAEAKRKEMEEKANK
jgi:hypothetical protein